MRSEGSGSRYSGFVRCIPKWYAVIRFTAPPFARCGRRAAVQSNRIKIKGDRNGAKGH